MRIKLLLLLFFFAGALAASAALAQAPDGGMPPQFGKVFGAPYIWPVALDGGAGPSKGKPAPDAGGGSSIQW